MGFLTHDQTARIIRLRSNRKGASEIVRILVEDDIKISRWSIIRFLRQYYERQSLKNAPKSRCPSQGVTTELMNFMDTEMEKNDELTSPQLLRRILLHSYYNFHRKKSGDFDGSLVGFKQALIRKPNRVKLLELSEKCLRENKQFDNVTFKDKCSVHKWEQPKLKGKLKHPGKVHVWAGISKRGPTEWMVFEDIMDAQFYVSKILSNGPATIYQNNIAQQSLIPTRQ